MSNYGLGEVGFILAVLALYPLPAYVAYWRGHPRRRAIQFFGLVTGWTIVGWVAALAWALDAFQRDAGAGDSGPTR